MRREPGVGVGVLGPQVRQGARIVAVAQPEVVVDAPVAVHGHVLGLARRDGKRGRALGEGHGGGEAAGGRDEGRGALSFGSTDCQRLNPFGQSTTRRPLQQKGNDEARWRQIGDHAFPGRRPRRRGGRGGSPPGRQLRHGRRPRRALARPVRRGRQGDPASALPQLPSGRRAADARQRHVIRISPLVVRGADDKGAIGMRCTTCHQDANFEPSGVPGHPLWHVAPKSDGLADRAR